MSHTYFSFLILLVYSFIIYLYLLSTYLVPTLGIQMVNIHCPALWIVLLNSCPVSLYDTALETTIPALLLSAACWRNGCFSARTSSPFLGVCLWLTYDFMSRSISASFSSECSKHRNIFLSEHTLFFVTRTKPNPKYLITQYLMLNS